MIRRFLVLLVSLLVVSAACSDDDSSNADAGQAETGTDSGGPVDMGANDAQVPSDATAPEDTGMATDMALDSGSDIGVEQDAETGTDMGSTDAAGEDGCAPGTTRTVAVDGAVVACARAGETVNQCDAGTLCGAGWHLCTGSEYRANYEAMEPPAVADGTYWIASCIRDGGAPTSPSDQVCSDCTGQATGAQEDVGFSCVNAVRLTSEQLYVGVRAGSACTFVGVDQAGNDAYWSAQPSSALQSGAFCCID